MVGINGSQEDLLYACMQCMKSVQPEFENSIISKGQADKNVKG